MDMAHRGTLFLDEIGELPLAIQAKLLRVLKSEKFERVGGHNRLKWTFESWWQQKPGFAETDPEKMFRDDLYFRISAVPMTIPPLRERGNDVLRWQNTFWNNSNLSSESRTRTSRRRPRTVVALPVAGKRA